MITNKRPKINSKLTDWHENPTPAIIAFVTAIIPLFVMILGFNRNPWYILAYSSVAIPLGVISVIFGLIGLKTKLCKLSVVSLVITAATVLGLIFY